MIERLLGHDAAVAMHQCHKNTLLSLCALAIAACGLEHDPREAGDADRAQDALADLPYLTVVPHMGDYPDNFPPYASGQSYELHITNPWDVEVNYDTGGGVTRTLAPHETAVLPDLAASTEPFFIRASAPVGAMMIGTMHNPVESRFAFPGVSGAALTGSVKSCPEVSGRDAIQRTIIGVTNPSDDTVSASIEFQDRDGGGFTKPSFDVAARSTVFVDVKAEANGRGISSWLGSATVVGSADVLATVTKINNNSTSTAYHCASGGSRALSVPEYKRKQSGGEWTQWNVLAVQNVSSQPAHLTVTFEDPEHEQAFTPTLAAGESYAFNSRYSAELSVLGTTFNGAVTVESDQDVVALNTVRIAKSGDLIPVRDRAGQYRVADGARAAQDLVFPSIHKLGTGGATRYGHINLFNPQSSSATVTVTFYDRSGGNVFEETVSIGAGKTHWWNTAFKNAEDIDDGFEGSVRVHADQPIFGVLQQLSPGDQLNAPAIAVAPAEDTVVTTPGVKLTQHIEGFEVQAMCDEQMAPEGWTCDNSPEGLLVKSALHSLYASSNPTPPDSMAGDTWSAWVASKEYRGYADVPPFTLTCGADGTVEHTTPAGDFNYGYTRGPGGLWFADPDVYVGPEEGTPAPWFNDYWPESSDDGRCVTMRSRRASRIAHAERVVVYDLLGFDQPFVWHNLYVTACCDGTVDVSATHSQFPDASLYIDDELVARDPGEKLGEFMKVAGVEWNEDGYGVLAPSSSLRLGW